MRLFELVAVVGAIAWISHALRHGGRFEHAWLTLFLGLGLMLSRIGFVLGAILACVSVGLLSLPLARAEWERLHDARSRGRSGSG